MLLFATLLMLLDVICVTFLFIAMVKIYRVVTYNFATWQPNKCSIAIQVLAFTAPVVVFLLIIVIYIPEENRQSMTVRHLALYSLQQMTTSVIMIALLYVVTKYSIQKQVFTDRASRQLEEEESHQDGEDERLLEKKREEDVEDRQMISQFLESRPETTASSMYS